jgi:putative transcriptional regulator
MKDANFKDFLKSIDQARAIQRGTLKPSKVTTFNPIDIKKIREKLHTSQVELANMTGVSVFTLDAWERGERRPEGAALAVLRIADVRPDAIIDALKL